MNERIQQLINECEDFGSWDNKVYLFDKEKFAKLIVQECFRIATQKEDGDTSDYNSGRSWAGIDILKHFGVEE